jgi:mono/diheme cytochrome c family protein
MMKFIAPVFCIGFAVGAAAGEAPSSTRQGVYTEEQATRGAEVYEQNCAICHGADLAGNFETPNLRGYFIGLWTGASLDLLYDYVSTAMPLYAPGALPPETYADVVAYLLKANGAPAASRALSHDAAALRGIIINAPVK